MKQSLKVGSLSSPSDGFPHPLISKSQALCFTDNVECVMNATRILRGSQFLDLIYIILMKRLSLKNLMDISATLQEFQRFIHQPLHYQNAGKCGAFFWFDKRKDRIPVVASVH